MSDDGYTGWGNPEEVATAEQSRREREAYDDSRHPDSEHYDPAPHNLECEAALLGALMIDNRMVDEVPTLQARHFYDEFHAYVFGIIRKWYGEGRKATPITLRDVVGGGDPDAQKKSARYLVDCTGSGAALIGAREFAQQLIDLADLRTVRSLAMEAIKRCENGEEDLDAHGIASDMESKIGESLTTAVKRHTFTFAEAFDDVTAEYQAIEAGAQPPGFKIARFTDWNAVVGRMEPQDFILLGARPSMGKTGVGAAVALGAAEAGIGVDFLSLEMDRRKASRRIIAQLLYDPDDPIPYEDLAAGRMNMARWRRFGAARDTIAELPLTISDPPVMYIEDLAPHLRKRKREFEKRGQELRLCVADYLGRFDTRRKLNGPTEIVSHISRTLKAVAKQEDMVIVALAQLSRGLEQRENKRPMLSDLRDSGSLEQDADSVAFLYREEYYLERLEPKHGTEKWNTWKSELEDARDNMEIFSAKRREGALSKRTSKFLTKFQAVLDHHDPRVTGGGWDLFNDDQGFPEARG